MYKRRITVRGIILNAEEIFAQQLNKTVAKGDDWWCTPGGGVEDGEDLISALHREMIEETGVKPEIGRLLFIQQYTEKDDHEQLEFFFHIKNAEDYKTINLDDTTHGAIEIAHYGFVKPSEVNLLPANLQTLNVTDHIDHNQPVAFFTHLAN